MGDDLMPTRSGATVWILGIIGAGIGVLGGFLHFYRGSSFHWLDFGGEFSTHLPILWAVVRGLVAPALVVWAAYLGIGGRERVAGPLMLGTGAVWLAWMIQAWLDYASCDTCEKAGPGLYVMILGAALTFVAGAIATLRTMREADRA